MKQLLTVLLLCFSIWTQAQSYEDSWRGFFSYVSVKAISEGNDKVYVGVENAVYSVDLTTAEIKTITTVNGLSGEFISTIHYSEDYQALFIGYENGFMEVIVDGEEEVVKVVDILDKPTIPPNTKRINHFNEYEGNLYIATQYGISVYDIANLEFGDTYFIGELGTQINITQTTVLEPYIYASTQQEGIKRALVDDDNLIDYAQWAQVENGNISFIQALGNDVYFSRNDNRIYKFSPFNSTLAANLNGQLVDFHSKDGVLTATTDLSIYAYSEGIVPLGQVISLNGITYELQSGLAFDNYFYLGTVEQGMLKVPFGSTTYEQILPDGPIRNDPFAIDASPGQVWVAFGDITVNFNPFPLSFYGVSNFKDDVWTNLEPEELLGASDIVHVKINPMNPSEVYMSSFQKGLLKIVDQSPQILYDESNSALELSPINGAGVRIYGADFDRNNDLWITQSRIEEGLIRYTTGGQFQKVPINVINNVNELALGKVAVSREGHVFFGSAQSGLLGFNTNTGAFNRINEGIGSGNLPSPDIRSLTFDNNNRLWIGTREGLRVLFNVGGFFDQGSNTDAQEIIILEDGVAQELLYQQPITDIEVDGSNNKWIATATSGVFYVSSNGQETLNRFTIDNSPLPSNNVQDIAIDDVSGRVYFATTKGLVAFEGTATAPRDNLENVYAYPNPVRPGFKGNVTIDGLTSNANVKITDIEGNLVFETTSEGGSVLWDTSAFGKYKVASGVYLVLITSADALETKIAKIMVVR